MPRRRFSTIICVAALACAVPACDSSDPSIPSIQGEYSASFTYVVNDQPFQENWTVTLSESADGMVAGSGLQGSEPVEIMGSHDHPDIELDFVSDKDGFIGTLTATVTDDGSVIEGRYNFSIVFVDIPLTLRKVM